MTRDFGARQLRCALGGACGERGTTRGSRRRVDGRRALGMSGSFYAVFDGHSGEQCSEFCSKQLQVLLEAELAKAQKGAEVGRPPPAVRGAAAAHALEGGAGRRGGAWVHHAGVRCGGPRVPANCKDPQAARRVLLHCGAAPGLHGVRGERGRLSGGASGAEPPDAPAPRRRRARQTGGQDGDGKAVRLSEDHKPEREDETKRVKAAGGHVLKYGETWRVTSSQALAWEQQKIKTGPRPIQPAVSRSFGDISLKQPRALLVSTPEITVRQLKPTDRMLLLGCDGIWDVLSDDEAVALAAGALTDGESAKGVAGAVVTKAYAKGSTDNISAVVVLLGECADLAEAAVATSAAAPK